MPLASGGQRLGMVLDNLQSTGQPPTMENHLAANGKRTKAENPCMRAMVLESLMVPGLLLGDGSGPWACAIRKDPQGL